MEYITAEGTIQHTEQAGTSYRNGFSLIVPKGRTAYRSFKRKAGRHAIVRVYGNARIDSLALIESILPVEKDIAFRTNDQSINAIWDASYRTLRLCMEDTFTDCPLYEQNFWVGDARNEALYAYATCGGYDLAKRCIEFASESLDVSEMTAPCVPSTNDSIIPAWSFLWCRMLEEYYRCTGDAQFVSRMMPRFKQNIEHALRHLNEEGLFEAELWNLFDWGPIDWNGKKTLLYNSILLGAAADSGALLARVINDSAYEKECIALKASVNRRYTGSYPDNTEDASTRSLVTQAVAYIYDFCDQFAMDDSLIQAGSPFALQFVFEAQWKAGERRSIIDRIREAYEPMLHAGSDTVWEVFPGTVYGPKGFPTRSHVHAWSSSPLNFFRQIIAGLSIAGIGGREYVFSPPSVRIDERSVQHHDSLRRSIGAMGDTGQGFHLRDFRA